jgi:hypothetical protein
MKRTEKITEYGNAFNILTNALERYPKVMWHYRSSEDEWTIHEILVHITDSEANSYIRARRLIAEPGKPIMAYDEMAWAKNLDYHDLDTEDAIQLFRLLRGTTYKLVKTLPEKYWSHASHHPENGETTLDDWLDVYTRHVPEHIEQMDEVLRKWNASK